MSPEKIGRFKRTVLMFYFKTFRVCLMLLATSFFGMSMSVTNVAANNDCDQALAIFWKGKYAYEKTRKYRFYEVAINLCPGFIRPY